MKKAFVPLMIVGLVSIAKAQTTNMYHFAREFVPVTNSVDPVTTYKIIMGADQLTGIVGPTNIMMISNQTFATEYEGFSWGYDSHYAAWTSALAAHPNYFHVYSNVLYDNVGYIKGTREAYGSHGAFVWFLQNTIAFTSSASTVYVDASGVTSPIASVLVGTIGDYCPQTVVTDVGPLLNTNYLGAGISTDYVARADVNAYYKLVPSMYFGVNHDDSDIDGIPDFADGYNLDSGNNLDNLSKNDGFTPWKLLLSGYADPTQAQFRITYSASDPMYVSVTTNGYMPASGHFRLWRKQGFRPRIGTVMPAGGDYIPPGVYTATSLGFSASTRLVDVYVEPVNPGADLNLMVEIDPDGDGPRGFICMDRIAATVLEVEIENTAPRDTHDIQVQHFTNNAGVFNYTAIPLEIYYHLQPDSGWMPGGVELRIKNPAGSTVRTIALPTSVGQQQTTWDGKDDSGDYVANGSNYVVEIVTTIGGTTCTATNGLTVYEIRQGNCVYRPIVINEHAAILYEYLGGNQLADLQNSNNYTVMEHPGPDGTTGPSNYGNFNNWIGAFCPPGLSSSQRKAILEKARELDAANIPYVTVWELVTALVHNDAAGSPAGNDWAGTVGDILRIRCDGTVEVAYEDVGERLYGDNAWWSIMNPGDGVGSNLRLHNDGSNSINPQKQRVGINAAHDLTRNREDAVYLP